jgi:hypothetical protein
MRARTVGLGLLGLGAFLLAGALAVWVFLVPGVVKLPLDQTAEPTAVGTDVEWFDLSAQKQLRGLDADVRQRVEGDPTSDDAGDDVAVWNFGSTITDADSGELLNAGTYRVCLDRHTAEAVDCDAAHVDYDDDVEITGLTLTFPFGTEQRDYDVFNATAGASFPATFEGVEELGGLEVYRFQLSIPETVIRELEVPGAMAGAPDEATVQAEVVYSNERTIWVEPTSGVIVTAEEHPDTVLRGPDGTEGITLLAGTFAGDEQTVADGVARAEDFRSQITLVKQILPLSLLGAGLVVLLVALLLIRRGRPEADRWDDDEETAAVREPQVQ